MLDTLTLLDSYVDNYLKDYQENCFILEMDSPSENKLKEKAITSFLNKKYKDKLITILSKSKNAALYVSKEMALYHATNKYFYAHIARIMITDISLYNGIINVLDMACNGFNVSNVATVIMTLAGLYVDSVLDNKNTIEKLEDSLKYIGRLPK